MDVCEMTKIIRFASGRRARAPYIVAAHAEIAHAFIHGSPNILFKLFMHHFYQFQFD